MINTDFRTYNYYSIGELDEYGQNTIGQDLTPKGLIKMAIYITTQSIQNNINYSNAQYVGLTKGDVNDKFIIDYDGRKLKVLYINPKGRYKQVFLGEL